MGSQDLEKRVEKELLSLSSEDFYPIAERLRAVIDRAILSRALPTLEYQCPRCNGGEFVRCGYTAAGTQRWKCKGCGLVRTHCQSGGILANTKLDREKWMEYIPLFLAHVPCSAVEAQLKVTHRTAWFMRVRMLEAAYNELPAFQAKAGCNTQIDEMYFRESFKGTRFDTLDNPPRAPRTGKDVSYSRGMNDEKICVMTMVNDSRDFLFDVSCRGPLNCDVAMEKLMDRIEQGAIVNTDRHFAYPKVLSALGVAVHNAFRSEDHEYLSTTNHIDGNLRAFLKPFHGVSTKWLHIYLSWYKWLMCFGTSDIAIRHVASGDYVHCWRSIRAMGTPFRDASFNAVKC